MSACTLVSSPESLSITGAWAFSDNISSESAGISCAASGTVTLDQSATNFTGTFQASTGICTDSFGNQADISGAHTVSGGQIDGHRVSFHTTNCQYQGTITGSPPNRMDGTETCTLAIAGTNYTLTGPWQASR